MYMYTNKEVYMIVYKTKKKKTPKTRAMNALFSCHPIIITPASSHKAYKKLPAPPIIIATYNNVLSGTSLPFF